MARLLRPRPFRFVPTDRQEQAVRHRLRPPIGPPTYCGRICGWAIRQNPSRRERRRVDQGNCDRGVRCSVVAVVAGAVLAFAAVWLAYANGAFVMSGPDVIGIQPTASAWVMVALLIVAALAVIGGFIGGLAVDWALLNTAQLEDKTWFIVLLVLGLLSFGLVAMIAYVIGGPDGTGPARSESRR